MIRCSPFEVEASRWKVEVRRRMKGVYIRLSLSVLRSVRPRTAAWGAFMSDCLCPFWDQSDPAEARVPDECWKRLPLTSLIYKIFIGEGVIFVVVFPLSRRLLLSVLTNVRWRGGGEDGSPVLRRRCLITVGSAAWKTTCPDLVVCRMGWETSPDRRGGLGARTCPQCYYTGEEKRSEGCRESPWAERRPP